MNDEVETKTRKPSLKGKSLTSMCDENPRREGTAGHHSHQIILDNPGITYEDFREKGGRPGDLRWDLSREFVKAED